jgi:hypothetical protein
MKCDYFEEETATCCINRPRYYRVSWWVGYRLPVLGRRRPNDTQKNGEKVKVEKALEKQPHHDCSVMAFPPLDRATMVTKWWIPRRIMRPVSLCVLFILVTVEFLSPYALMDASYQQSLAFFDVPILVVDNTSDNNTISNNNSKINNIYSDRIKAFFDDLQHQSLSPKEASTVEWIQEYLTWHNEMRQQFPGYSIFEHPSAPRTAVKFEARKGDDKVIYGLTDRLHNIGSILQYCHQTKRVLFYKWFDVPTDLEVFLEPHLFNWTLPEHPQHSKLDALQFQQSTKEMTKLVLIDGKFIEEHRFIPYLDPVHIYWQVFFRPSGMVQAVIDQTMTTLSLTPKQYDAVHLRVGHPAFYNRKAYTEQTENRDYYESNFEAEPAKCMESAARAFQCARWLAWTHEEQQQQKQLPTNQVKRSSNNNFTIYFYADSSDLVNVVVNPTSFKPIAAKRKIWLHQKRAFDKLKIAIDPSIRNDAQNITMRVTGRVNATIAHIGGVPGKTSATSLEGFVSTFVDLYIASQARCITLGAGRYAFFAAKIGNISCLVSSVDIDRLVGNRWGMQQVRKNVPSCPVS